jgi:membrane protease YdiL (CAAX protease family)
MTPQGDGPARRELAGERPGRADLGAVVFVLLYPAAFTWAYFVLLSAAPTSIQQAVYAAGKALQFAFPLAWAILAQRRRLRLARPNAAGLAAGLAFGAAVFAAMLLLYFDWLKPGGTLETVAQGARQKVAGFGIDTKGAFLALAVFYSAVHSLLEEYYWRWFAFGELARWIEWKRAVAVSSLAFAAHHVVVLGAYFGPWSWTTWILSLAVAVGGAFWAWLYRKSGSLYGPWLSHLVIDAAIFTIGYDLVGL